MTGLRLIVETPRGGDSGHRVLTSRNSTTESEIASLLSASSERPFGQNYIGVSRTAKQVLANGSVREGTEQIVLAGINANSLTADQVRRVEAGLVSLYSDLDRLIRGIDWSSEGKATVIIRDELREWLERDDFRGLPDFHISTKMSPKAPAATLPRRRTTSRLVIVLCVLCVLCVTCLWWLRGSRPPGNKPIEDPTKPDPAIAQVQALANDWKCAAQEVVTSLLRTANWDKRRDAEAHGLPMVLDDAELRQMLVYVVESQGTERFLKSPVVLHEPQFREFVERLSVDSESARTLRTRLYSSWKKSDALQYKSKIARPVLAQIENKDVYLRMMEICSNYEPEVSLGQDFMEPKTPLFDRQDVMIYRMLSHYRDGFREAGFDQILIESNNGEESTPKDVLAFVGLLNGQYDSIRGTIEDSRASWTDRVRKEQGKDEADKLFDTYEALEGLLRELASIASR